MESIEEQHTGPAPVISQSGKSFNRHRWTILITNLFVSFSIQLINLSHGRLLPELLSEYPNETTVIFWGASIGNAFPYILSYPTLRLYRNIGFVATCCSAIISTMIGILIFIFVDNVYMVIVGYGIMAGLGTALFKNALTYKTHNMFPYEHKYHVLTTGLVGLIFPLTLTTCAHLTDYLISVHGWRITIGSYLGLSFFLGIAAVSVTYKLQQIITYEKKVNEGNVVIIKLTKMRHSSSSSMNLNQSSTEIDSPISSQRKGKCFCDSHKLIIIVLWATVSVFTIPCLTSTYVIIVQHALILGYDTQKGTSLQVISAASNLIISIMTILIGDRFIKGKCLVIYIIILPFGILMNILVARWTEYWQLILFSVIINVITGIYFTLLYPICSELLGKTLVKELFSIALSSTGLGSVFIVVA